MPDPTEQPKPVYRWPWFVLAAFVVAVILAIAWLSVAVRNVRERRDRIERIPETQPQPVGTNSF